MFKKITIMEKQKKLQLAKVQEKYLKEKHPVLAKSLNLAQYRAQGSILGFIKMYEFVESGEISAVQCLDFFRLLINYCQEGADFDGEDFTEFC